jgi:phenylalanyl-tRNA synthetase beta chain
MSEKDINVEISVPSYRNDIEIKEDIVEEILRIYGYDNIPPAVLPTHDKLKVNTLGHNYLIRNKSKRVLVNIGYKEVVTWSFMSSENAKHFTTLNNSLYIANPITSDLDYMRPSIIPNLLVAIKKNLDRHYKNLSLCEVGPTYSSTSPDGHKLAVSGVRIGENCKKNIYEKVRKIDFFDIKADVFELIEECGFKANNLIIKQEAPIWGHPAKSATIMIGKTIIGYLGEVHPSILKRFDISDAVFAFEVFLELIPTPKNKKGRKPAPDYSDYQAVSRDFAFLIDDNVNVGEIEKSIQASEKKLIKSIELFDIYQGQNTDNKKSVAFSVIIQSNDKTLTDEEIEKVCKDIIMNVEKSHGAVLRK